MSINLILLLRQHVSVAMVTGDGGVDSDDVRQWSITDVGESQQSQ